MTNPAKDRHEIVELLAETSPGLSQRQFALTLCFSVIVAFTAWSFVEPPCPTKLTLHTGTETGAYHAFGVEYQKLLRGHGVELTLASSQGSVENLNRLRSRGQRDATLAIVQGGARSQADRSSADATRLVSLTSLFQEPIWVFYRGAIAADELSDLAGMRVAIGKEGSGTRQVALTLLGDGGLLESQSPKLTLVALGGDEAERALLAGEIDAAFFVISVQSPRVHRLLHAADIELMSFRRAPALARRYAYLTHVTLHEGVLDMEQNLPPKDINLVAAAANLVADRDVHPALPALLVSTARKVHERGDAVSAFGEFPAVSHLTLPVDARARHYFENGQSLLFRWFPFRWASWLDRIKILALPLITLLIPLFKIAPPIYRWRIRRRIYRWYALLREFDSRLRAAKADQQFQEELIALDRINADLAEIEVPLSYMEEAYNLRLHVGNVQQRIRQHCTEAGEGIVRPPQGVQVEPASQLPRRRAA